MKISLVICVWNTSHLLKRSIETYCAQDFPKDDWELIVVDDNSLDDVKSAIAFAEGKINMQYIRLDHNFGMRGNTVAFNTGFAAANSRVIAETTPETMFTPDAVRLLYEPHIRNHNAFVAMKTYNLTPSDQLLIDTVDWRADLSNIHKLPNFNDPWTQNNVKHTHFGTHQTCSIEKETFRQLSKGHGFPLYGDYGSDDPWYSGTRSKYGINDITIMEPLQIHQWHLPFNYFASMGYAPMLNKWNHSISNYLNDKSGEVPANGTSQIWDTDKGNQFEKMNPEEMKHWQEYDEIFVATGGDPKIIKR